MAMRFTKPYNQHSFWVSNQTMPQLTTKILYLEVTSMLILTQPLGGDSQEISKMPIILVLI